MAEYSAELASAQRTLPDEDEICEQVVNVASWTKKTPVEHGDDSSESTSTQIHLKNEGSESLGYPVQETDHGTEADETQSENNALQEGYSATSSCCNSFESTEQKAKEGSSQEYNFEDTKSSETECNRSYESVHSRTEPEPPPGQQKTAKTKQVKKRRISNTPKDSKECRSGSGSGGGGAKKQKRKEGNSGRMDIQPTIVSALDNAEQYLSPGCGEATIVNQQLDSPRDVQKKMKGDFPVIPSLLDNLKQNHSPGHGEAATAGQKFDFHPQDLQHACYCRKTDCPNMLCKDVKAEIKHMKDHQGWKQYSPCSRCTEMRAVIQKHANVCKVQGYCQVPDCHNIRKGTNDNKGTGKTVPTQMQWQNYPPSGVNNLAPERDGDESGLDGLVIFSNSKFLCKDYFRENTDYEVDRNNKLGAGTNGTVYPVSLHRDGREIVVKETNFRKEELEVYSILGEHKNIVTHYGVTFRGNDRRKVSIFMEKCDMSLFSYMHERLQRRLTSNEAMFYWVQVLEGVCHLHNLPIPVIHKNIKAKNVLLSGRRAKLADFDSALRLPHECTEAGLKPCGTSGFASPEVEKRKSHGKPTDVYGMGCFLIELVIGPPINDTLKEKIGKLREVDAYLALLVEACVKECPEERPAARSLLAEWEIVKKYIPGDQEWSYPE